MTMMDDTRATILLSAQRALLGEVFPTLNKVYVSWGPGSIKLTFLLSEPPNEKDKDSMSSIETEMLADFFPDREVSSDFSVGKRNDESETVCIFARRDY